MTIGKIIRRLRLQRGWTQDHLAKLAGTESIAMIEGGFRVQPQYDTVHKIAGAFGLTTDELYQAGKKRK